MSIGTPCTFQELNLILLEVKSEQVYGLSYIRIKLYALSNLGMKGGLTTLFLHLILTDPITPMNLYY